MKFPDCVSKCFPCCLPNNPLQRLEDDLEHDRSEPPVEGVRNGDDVGQGSLEIPAIHVRFQVPNIIGLPALDDDDDGSQSRGSSAETLEIGKSAISHKSNGPSSGASVLKVHFHEEEDGKEPEVVNRMLQFRRSRAMSARNLDCSSPRHRRSKSVGEVFFERLRIEKQENAGPSDPVMEIGDWVKA